MDFDKSYTMTINGAGVAGAGTYPVLNPATEEIIAQAPDCSAAQLDEAIAAARRAFPAWKATPIEQRQKLVLAIAGSFIEHATALGALLTREQGKPLAEARAEAMAPALWAQALAAMQLPVTVNEDSAELRSETHHVPLGVVGAISPWNFPVLLTMWKVLPALVAGNTVVLKPSPHTPLTVLKIGEMLRGVLPPGVLNVVTGGDELGPWMTAHEDIDKITFTGSTPTGKKVLQSAAGNLKRVTLELGGNDPAIVLPDVNVDEIAPRLFWSAFKNSGQVCIATKRMYVHKDIYDDVARALVAYARTVKVGNGADEGTQLGPVQNRPQYERVKNLIEDAHAHGLRFLAGGEVPVGPGYFLPISIVDNPPEDARVVSEEAFGPVLPLLRYDDIDEAVRRANDSPYGLGASVWSADTDRALSVAVRLECGNVWINDCQYLRPNAMFAGHKQSGIGVENGVEGLLEYTNPQTIVMRKSAAAR
ncbi:MAG: aldehyde dehydrogenase family protein [Pseudomonadota bacterium]